MAKLCFVIVVKKSRIVANSWPELTDGYFPEASAVLASLPSVCTRLWTSGRLHPLSAGVRGGECCWGGQTLDSKGYKTELCPVANCELLRMSCASQV